MARSALVLVVLRASEHRHEQESDTEGSVDRQLYVEYLVEPFDGTVADETVIEADK